MVFELDYPILYFAVVHGQRHVSSNFRIAFNVVFVHHILRPGSAGRSKIMPLVEPYLY
jgi:hypothetical protein